MGIETMKVSELRRSIAELEVLIGDKRLYGADAVQDGLSQNEQKLDELRNELDKRNRQWPVPARAS